MFRGVRGECRHREFLPVKKGRLPTICPASPVTNPFSELNFWRGLDLVFELEVFKLRQMNHVPDKR
jgi:hypothetical protein